MQTPSERYRMSPRAMPEVIAPPDYESQAFVRSVDPNGFIAFKGRQIRGSKAFAGKRVAFRATATDGLYDLYYRRHVLAQIDLRQDTVKSVHHVPVHPSTLSTV